jgi:hypothetical protein
MSRRTTRILKAVLSTLHYSGADSMIAPFTRGIGAIFMLHHVNPEKPGRFEPNRILKITPQFLELVIRQVRQSGFEIVSLDEAHFRLIEGDYGKPFVCFTFDDGYRDNLEHAYPIFKRHNLPFAVYVPTDYADGRGDLWWLALEKVIVQVDALSMKIDGSLRRLRCGTPAEKDATFQAIYWWLRGIDEADARAFVRDLCDTVDYDASGLCSELMMTSVNVTFRYSTMPPCPSARLIEMTAVPKVVPCATPLARSGVELSTPFVTVTSLKLARSLALDPEVLAAVTAMDAPRLNELSSISSVCLSTVDSPLMSGLEILRNIAPGIVFLSSCSRDSLGGGRQICHEP